MSPKIGAIEALRSLTRLLRGRPRIPSSLADSALLRVILHRRSVRSFTPRPISEDVWSAILEAGRLAPSTVNLQTWTFALFDDEQWRQAFGQTIPFRASRAVIVIADTHRVRTVLDVFPHSPLLEHTVAVMNASLAAMNMSIAAEALGVSSVMLSDTGRSGLLDARYLADRLRLPEAAIPLMTIVFGYARGPYPPMPPKLPAEQVQFSGEYCPADRKTMVSWLSQMTAGYKASHLSSSFERQLDIYRQEIDKAEADLMEMVFGREEHDEAGPLGCQAGDGSPVTGRN